LSALAWGLGSWGRGAAYIFRLQTASTRWSINAAASTSSFLTGAEWLYTEFLVRKAGRWVFFHAVLNVTGVIVSPVNFLDVGQSAWVAGQRVSVVWRNSTHARVVVGLPTLADVVGANATFVVGSGAAAIDSVAAVYARARLLAHGNLHVARVSFRRLQQPHAF
jgi:hypothetical protein